MAAKTAASEIAGQGVIRVFRFSSIDSGDTFVGPSSPRAFWYANKTASSSAAVGVSESSGTYTFTTGANGLAIDLFVLL